MSFIDDFAAQAFANATRYALHTGKFFPIPEAVMVVVDGEASLLGARVFFEPPVEAVWIAPNLSPSIATYDQARQNQAPLTATYYVFPIIDHVLQPVTKHSIAGSPSVL